MFELSILQWLVVILCAIFIGFTKTGVSSLGILVVTILMFIFPAKESVGILLPLLIIGDIFAVIYYRRNVVWKYLVSLIPWVLIGIMFGFYVLNEIDSEQLKPVIGALVLLLILLHVIRERLGERFNKWLPGSIWFIGLMGVLAGFTTMIGNAAGGVMAIYLLVKGLPKREFIGTGAWFFLFVNLIKVPFYIYLGLITTDSFLFNLSLLPTVIIGAFIGIKIIPLIPQRVFQILILTFAAVGALRLLIA
ncbi:sulfite exporter TauE/SafE family protein [Aquibacillus koreensis]|uniref:Probable membrane transporter protein n=1 Tax=Aquibacillus koreensis TaxID=279446 RepID=A0A9X3WJJ2_9BACI|nr:sulfite exporter TauE/SafE family protein [Aquibacillus koreensis]MCT2537721.1 sulfite exporter TauE/SafE family protein [Aquibacillus koreensis]MDC3420932.1 sulfite exporter TauE/SafE family protein [Aquibacillus koreensis]